MGERILKARAPGRVDFGGGGTDVAPYCVEHHGVVVNAAINYYAHATLEPRSDGAVQVHAVDLGLRESFPSINAVDTAGPLELIKACIRRVHPERGFNLTTYSEIPAGSGLSSSAAVAVLTCAITSYFRDGAFDQEAMAHLASSVERDDLNHWTGKQDQAAAALGGFNFLAFVGDAITWEPANLPLAVQRQLEKNLVLVYTGQAHLAGNIHLDILADYKNQRGTVLPGMHGLKRVGSGMIDALQSRDLPAFAGLMNENWKYHQMLHPSCATDRLQAIIGAGLAHGAMGAKVCGAGGGGCVIFLAEDNRVPELTAALRRMDGQILPFSFDSHGVIVWS